METKPQRGYRLIVDFKSQFPEKLFDVVNDGYLVHWNRNGSVSVKDEDEFERSVMRLYPGFLQIPSFLNFKRLFREYGFDKVVNQNNQFEFSHPYFVRDRRDLTRKIVTRRKAMKVPCEYQSEEPLVFQTEDGRRYSTRKRKRSTRFSQDNNCPDSDQEGQGDIGQSYIISHTDMKRYPVIKHPVTNSNMVPNQNTNLQAPQSQLNTSMSKEMVHNNRPNFQNIMEKYAEREFTEQEYAEWIAKQRKMDKAKEDAVAGKEKDTRKPREFWWMYDEKEEVNNINDLKEKQVTSEACMPCGFCKCCSAISNYVHIFGEIPENIQVFDYVVEVPAETKVDTEDKLDVASEIIIETQ